LCADAPQPIGRWREPADCISRGAVAADQKTIDGDQMDGNGNSATERTREEFVRLLTGEQAPLFGYITTLLGDVNDASNVLQHTNMVLWRKADEFVSGTNFHVWARKIAYYQTLAYLRDRKRDLLEQLASRPAIVEDDERRVALRHCLSSISANSLELLQQRYLPGKSIAEIAKRRHKSESAIKMALLRIRQTLVACVERQLAEAR
jgi:RNA polymerase sigma-70 factor (ECF subfamily)